MTHQHIQPNAGRDPFAGHRVAVYKNLHKQAWSLRALDGPHKGRVIAHAPAVGLTRCHMHINERIRLRIATGAAREVHAWIVGTLAEVELAQPQRISYRPHERGTFIIAATGQPIWTADAVLFTDAAYIETAEEHRIPSPSHQSAGRPA